MPRLRTVVTAVLLATVTAAVAEAQSPQGQAQGMRRMAPMAVVDRWLEGITLTAGQRAAVDSLKAVYEPQALALRAEMRAAMQGGTVDRDAMVKRNDELNASAARDVRAVLSADQLAAFDRNREAADAQRRQMMQRGPGRQGARPSTP